MLWTLALAALCVVLAGLMWWGWRNRARKQAAFPELPQVPADTGADLTAPITGLYVSTVYAGQWQNRVLAAGMGRRAQAGLRITEQGIEITRTGESTVWIPAADLVEVGTAPGTAGKVMGTPDGILLITWRWAGTAVASGIRGDDLHAQVPWIEAAEQLIKTGENSNGVAS